MQEPEAKGGGLAAARLRPCQYVRTAKQMRQGLGLHERHFGISDISKVAEQGLLKIEGTERGGVGHREILPSGAPLHDGAWPVQYESDH